MTSITDKIWAAIQRPAPSVAREEIEAIANEMITYGIPLWDEITADVKRAEEKMEAIVRDSYGKLAADIFNSPFVGNYSKTKD